MSKSRMYGWNGEFPVKDLSGQAKIVFDGLRADPGVLKTGHEWTTSIGPNLATKQDPYRVVLYYILILKSRGLIRTSEFDITAVTKLGDVRHGIVVRTAATVEEREVVADTPAITEVQEDNEDLVHETEDAESDEVDADEDAEDREEAHAETVS